MTWDVARLRWCMHNGNFPQCMGRLSFIARNICADDLTKWGTIIYNDHISWWLYMVVMSHKKARAFPKTISLLKLHILEDLSSTQMTPHFDLSCLRNPTLHVIFINIYIYIYVYIYISQRKFKVSCDIHCPRMSLLYLYFNSRPFLLYFSAGVWSNSINTN